MDQTAAQHVIIIANCVVNLALACVAITGNAFVLYGVWKTPSLRSPSNLLLCGLASTDLSVGLIAQPISITEGIVGLYSRSENLKLILDKADATIGLFLAGTSLFMMTGISIDRLIAIVKPLQYPSIVTSSRVTRILMAVWVVCVLEVSIQFWEERIMFAFVSSSVVICLSISIICHATMYKIMRRHRLQIHSQTQAFDDRNAEAIIISLRKSVFNYINYTLHSVSDLLLSLPCRLHC